MTTIPSYPAPDRALDGGEQIAGWQDGAQRSILAAALKAFILQDSAPTDVSSALAAFSATLSANSAGAAIAASLTAGVYPNAYATALPLGVTGLSAIGLASGTAGTQGVYAGGVTGGPAAFAWSYTIGADGKIASYSITNAGLATGNAIPTLSYPSGGLTGGTPPIATVASLIAVARNYWAASADSLALSLWSNNGSGAPVPVNSPDGSQISVPNAASLVSLRNLLTSGSLADLRDYELSGLVSSIAGADGAVIQGVWAADAAPPVPDPTAPEAPLPFIVGVGHSMVEQGIAEAISVALADPSRLGIKVPSGNLGRSGTTSSAIAINFGAETQLYQPVGKVIPADTSAVVLSPNLPGPLDAAGGLGGNTLGLLAGVFGTFTWTSGGPMTFARAVAGNPVPVPAPAPYGPIPYDRDILYAYPAQQAQRKVIDQARDSFAVLWIMRNDIADPYTSTSLASTAIKRYERIIGRLRARNKGFVILTELPSKTESAGNTPSLAHVFAINAALLRRWPRNAVDITTPFLAADNPRGALLVDDEHPSAAGRALIGGIVADAIVARGLLTDVSLPTPAVTPLLSSAQRGSATIQTIDGAFSRLATGPAQIDTALRWDATNLIYTIPETGTYELRASLRPASMGPASVSYGVGIGLHDGIGATGSDGMAWTTTNGKRESVAHSYVSALTRGDQIHAWGYADQALQIIEVAVTIKRIA